MPKLPSFRVLSSQQEIVLFSPGDGTSLTPENQISLGELSNFKVKQNTETNIVKPCFSNFPTTTQTFNGYELSFSLEKTDFVSSLIMYLTDLLFVGIDNDQDKAETQDFLRHIEPRFVIRDRTYYEPYAIKDKLAGSNNSFSSIIQNVGQSVLNAVMPVSFEGPYYEEYIYRDVVLYGWEKMVDGNMAPIMETIQAFSPKRDLNLSSKLEGKYGELSENVYQAILNSYNKGSSSK